MNFCMVFLGPKNVFPAYCATLIFSNTLYHFNDRLDLLRNCLLQKPIIRHGLQFQPLKRHSN